MTTTQISTYLSSEEFLKHLAQLPQDFQARSIGLCVEYLLTFPEKNECEAYFSVLKQVTEKYDYSKSNYCHFVNEKSAFFC